MLKEFKKVLISNKNFLDINPLDFGRVVVSNGYSHTQSQPMYYMYYIISGKLNLKIGGHTREYNTSNNLFIVGPNTKYEWSCPENESCSIMWIGFGGAFAKRIADLIPQSFKYQGQIFTELSDVWRLSEKEAYIASRLFQLYSELSQENASKSKNYVDEIKYYIAASFNSSNCNIDHIADSLGIDRRYMSRIFKKQEGMTPKEYLIRVRMAYAAYMIRLGYSLKEVALKCGYPDSHYFSTAFKKFYNITPSEYQKSPSTTMLPMEFIPQNFDWRISGRG